jgi:hypothetical protein
MNTPTVSIIKNQLTIPVIISLISLIISIYTLSINIRERKESLKITQITIIPAEDSLKYGMFGPDSCVFTPVEIVSVFNNISKARTAITEIKVDQLTYKLDSSFESKLDIRNVSFETIDNNYKSKSISPFSIDKLFTFDNNHGFTLPFNLESESSIKIKIRARFTIKLPSVKLNESEQKYITEGVAYSFLHTFNFLDGSSRPSDIQVSNAENHLISYSPILTISVTTAKDNHFDGNNFSNRNGTLIKLTRIN